MQIAIPMLKDAEIVKHGVFLDKNSAECDIAVVFTPIRYGSGDHRDEPEHRDNQDGEFYYVLLGEPKERGKLISYSTDMTSLNEAINWAEKRYSESLRWKN